MAHFINQELLEVILNRYGLLVFTHDEDNFVDIYLAEAKKLQDFTSALRNAMSEIQTMTGYNVRTFNYNYLNPIKATAIVIFDEPKPQPNVDRVLSHGPRG